MLIYNVTLVTPVELIENAYLYIEQGKIKEFGKGFPEHPNTATELDGQGGYLMAGIIDIHTDSLDTEIVPRKGADFPIEVAFRELERRMSGCGITTVYHSMHMGYEAAEAQSLSKYSRRELFEKVYELSQKRTLINNKIHLRYELTGVNAYDLTSELIQKGMVELLSVMDHTPGQGQQGEEGFINMMIKMGFAREEAVKHLKEKQARPKVEGEQLQRLIDLAHANHVSVASHDDDTAEKVMAMYQAGIRICEFPVSMEAAQKATELGMNVIGGAANVLRGGSLSGNMNIETGIKAGVIDSLCSDYYPPSLLHSVFKLHKSGMTLMDASNLVSLYPAKAVGINQKTGSIEVDKNADLILVNLHEDHPVVVMTIVNGHLVANANLQPQFEQAWN